MQKPDETETGAKKKRPFFMKIGKNVENSSSQ